LDEEARGVITSAFAFGVHNERIYLRSFVVMPDHWHALIALRGPWILSKFMHAMMSYVGGQTAALLAHKNTQWQDGYYDTRIKTAKQFEYVTRYIEHNPVAKGLVEKPEEWKASSASQQELVTTPWPWFLD
jgi:putative transposase